MTLHMQTSSKIGAIVYSYFRRVTQKLVSPKFNISDEVCSLS